jgi:hypothetical protein
VPQDALGYAATKAPVFKAASAAYADGNAVWVKGFGGQRQQDSNGAVFGGTTTGYGGAVGYERCSVPISRSAPWSAAAAAHTQSLSGRRQQQHRHGVRRCLRPQDLGRHVPRSRRDRRQSRQPQRAHHQRGLALQTATAAYGGWFVDPSLTLGRRIDIDGRGFTITPALKARYVAAHFDGYTETGSTANLTVAGRDFQAWEERAELTFANSTMMANGSRVTARGHRRHSGQQRSSGGQVNIAFAGAVLPRRDAGSREHRGRLWQRRPRLADGQGDAVRGGRGDLQQRRRQVLRRQGRRAVGW